MQNYALAGNRTLTFYAFDQTQAQRLAQQLRDFKLPSDVELQMK